MSTPTQRFTGSAQTQLIIFPEIISSIKSRNLLTDPDIPSSDKSNFPLPSFKVFELCIRIAVVIDESPRPEEEACGIALASGNEDRPVLVGVLELVFFVTGEGEEDPGEGGDDAPDFDGSCSEGAGLEFVCTGRAIAFGGTYFKGRRGEIHGKIALDVSAQLAGIIIWDMVL